MCAARGSGCDRPRGHRGEGGVEADAEAALNGIAKQVRRLATGAGEAAEIVARAMLAGRNEESSAERVGEGAREDMAIVCDPVGMIENRGKVVHTGSTGEL